MLSFCCPPCLLRGPKHIQYIHKNHCYYLHLFNAVAHGVLLEDVIEELDFVIFVNKKILKQPI